MSGDEFSLFQMSEAFQAFSAGILAHYPALMHFMAPHHNSMRLLKSGHLSYPTYQSWSLNHFPAPLRAIMSLKQQANKPPSASISHLELSHFDHTANLTLALALMTYCGMDGLKRGVKLP